MFRAFKLTIKICTSAKLSHFYNVITILYTEHEIGLFHYKSWISCLNLLTWKACAMAITGFSTTHLSFHFLQILTHIAYGRDVSLRGCHSSSPPSISLWGHCYWFVGLGWRSKFSALSKSSALSETSALSKTNTILDRSPIWRAGPKQLSPSHIKGDSIREALDCGIGPNLCVPIHSTNFTLHIKGDSAGETFDCGLGSLFFFAVRNTNFTPHKVQEC